MSNKHHVLVDSSPSSFGCLLDTSPLNKNLSTRLQVSRNRYGPSDVPSVSKMKQRISEAFGSSKNIIYSDQHPDPGVPETSLPLYPQQSLSPSSFLDPRRSLLSSSPNKRAAGRRYIPSSLPPSSPPNPSSSGDDETEEPACFPYRDMRRNSYQPGDPYGLLCGHQKFSRLRRHRRRQKLAAPRKRVLALVLLENLSPTTPCANSNSSPGQQHPGASYAPAQRGHHGERNGHPAPGGLGDGRQGHGGNRNVNGNTPDPDGSGGGDVSGASESLSDLLARLPRRARGRWPLPRQDDQDKDSRATSILTEPAKTAGEKKKRREKQQQKRAGDETSHLTGEDRVVRTAGIKFLILDLNHSSPCIARHVDCLHPPFLPFL